MWVGCSHKGVDNPSDTGKTPVHEISKMGGEQSWTGGKTGGNDAMDIFIPIPIWDSEMDREACMSS